MLKIRLAEMTIGIHHTHPHLALQCEKYRTEGEPDFEIAVTAEDIAGEKRNADVGATDGYCESIAAYRKIAQQLPSRDALLFHAAVIEVEGRAIAFTAASGTGKSTHIRLWRRVYGERVDIVNGDKPILRFLPDGKLYAFGTPWAGKEGWERNVAVPLSAIVFLERGESDRIEVLPKDEAALRIMPQILLGEDPDCVDATLTMLDRVLRATDTRLLYCTPTENAARVAYGALIQPEA